MGAHPLRVRSIVVGSLGRVSLMVCPTGRYLLRPSTQDGHLSGILVSRERLQSVGDVYIIEATRFQDLLETWCDLTSRSVDYHPGRTRRGGYFV